MRQEEQHLDRESMLGLRSRAVQQGRGRTESPCPQSGQKQQALQALESTHTPTWRVKQLETDPVLVVFPSLNCAGQSLGDTRRMDMGKGQSLMKALVKDWASQQQTR